MNCYRSWPYVSGLNSGRAPRCWQSSSKRNVFQRQKEACPDVRLGCTPDGNRCSVAYGRQRCENHSRLSLRFTYRVYSTL